ncbi:MULTISPECIES: YtxH domain-containing protein [unclassified Paenibacillus]|uniref:YtxH domain-containing protein n=1 Tax=unclassified Paenibacillus TaxID=185978 RepID=UPI00104FE5BA|nr:MULTISPECIES: YtxH domain-containing protein [unclassified Paenibacillus]NIK67147.1 gas vesicle protein [Paenibacillus sp. BK720]TCN01192.1 gas vesicle protein [Paenibacillus sp. BK033]
MPKENTGSGLLVGTIVGTAVGAVGALLLAPKTGVQLREDISNKFQALSQRTQELASTAKDKTKDVLSSVREEASDLTDRAKKSNEHVMDAFSAAKDDVKDKVRSTTN